MIVDALCKVAAAQQITADAVSASSFDTGNVTPKRNMAAGEALALVVCITAVGTNTGSAKLQAIQSAAAALTSPQILGEVDLASTDLVAGARIVIPIGQGIPNLRYLGLNADITGTVDFTIDAYIQPLSMASAAKPQSYAKNYTT